MTLAASEDGGHAFPRSPATIKTWDGRDEYEETHEGYHGMSLRDWFAGQVLPAVYTDNAKAQVYEESEAAKEAYRIADAMLKARVK